MNGPSALRWLRSAQVAAALAVLLLVRTVWSETQSLALHAFPVVQPTAINSADAALAPITQIAIDRTVAHNPFSPDRTPGPAYRVVKAGTALPLVTAAEVRLVGTVVRDGAPSFVLCQEGPLSARVVYPGQRIGALTLLSVQAGSATFTDTGGARVVLRVAKGGT